MTKAAKNIKTVLLTPAGVFCVFTALYLLAAGAAERVSVAVVSIPLLLLPDAVERLFKCRFGLAFTAFVYVYVICMMLGHCWLMYHIVSWWDIMLHCFGGVAFAVVGFYLPRAAGALKKNDKLPCAVFAVCFSMAVALGWEFFEYTADSLFKTDMQQDTFMSEIHSYKLSEEPGKVGSMSIDTVTINGGEAVFDGYLDIGLHDTMSDTIAGTLGSVAAAVLLYLNGDRRKILTLDREKDQINC